MPRSPNQEPIKPRRSYTDEFKSEAVQMGLDGHSARSIQETLRLPSTALLYRWRKQQVEKARLVGFVSPLKPSTTPGEICPGGIRFCRSHNASVSGA